MAKQQIPKLILVADDEKPLRVALVSKLEKEGYRVAAASNGEEALASARKEHPDFILMDIIMPRMHGVDAMRAIRAEAWGAAIPAILLTNLSNDSRALAFVNTDAHCEYILKSDVKIGDVVAKINHTLSA